MKESPLSNLDLYESEEISEKEIHLINKETKEVIGKIVDIDSVPEDLFIYDIYEAKFRKETK